MLNYTFVSTAFGLFENSESDDCSKYLQMRDWVTRKEDIKSLLAGSVCSDIFDTSVPSLIIHNKSKSCWDNFNAPILHFAELFNSAYGHFHPIFGGYSTETSQTNWQILFNSSNAGDEMAPFEGYGYLFQGAFDFTNETTAIVSEMARIGESDNSDIITISAHLRHRRQDIAKHNDPLLYKEYDEGFERAIKAIKDESHSSQCFLYLASDRPGSLEKLMSFAPTIGCVAKIAPRHMPSSWKEISSYFETHKDFSSEHGPWSEDRMAVADLYLLSRATHFVGSYGSTFSIMIANIIAARNARRSQGGAAGSLRERQRSLRWVEKGSVRDWNSQCHVSRAPVAAYSLWNIHSLLLLIDVNGVCACVRVCL